MKTTALGATSVSVDGITVTSNENVMRISYHFDRCWPSLQVHFYVLVATMIALPLFGAIVNWPWLTALSRKPEYLLLPFGVALSIVFLAALNRLFRPWQLTRGRHEQVARLSGKSATVTFNEIKEINVYRGARFYKWSVVLVQDFDRYCTLHWIGDFRHEEDALRIAEAIAGFTGWTTKYNNQQA